MVATRDIVRGERILSEGYLLERQRRNEGGPISPFSRLRSRQKITNAFPILPAMSSATDQSRHLVLSPPTAFHSVTAAKSMVDSF